MTNPWIQKKRAATEIDAVVSGDFLGGAYAWFCHNHTPEA